MPNFTFLKTDWPELYETVREAEQNLASTPGSTPLTLQLSHRLYARRSLERAVKLYANDSYLKQPYADNLVASLPPIFFLHISTTNKIFAT